MSSGPEGDDITLAALFRRTFRTLLCVILMGSLTLTEELIEDDYALALTCERSNPKSPYLVILTSTQFMSLNEEAATEQVLWLLLGFARM